MERGASQVFLFCSALSHVIVETKIVLFSTLEDDERCVKHIYSASRLRTCLCYGKCNADSNCATATTSADSKKCQRWVYNSTLPSASQIAVAGLTCYNISSTVNVFAFLAMYFDL